MAQKTKIHVKIPPKEESVSKDVWLGLHWDEQGEE